MEEEEHVLVEGEVRLTGEKVAPWITVVVEAVLLLLLVVTPNLIEEVEEVLHVV